jgi:hypothetical protein
MSQPPLPPDAPPPDSLATALKDTEQCSWLVQLINKTVYEMRAKSLTQANGRLDAEAMCHKAFTYELFAQMTREVLKKLDSDEQGSQQCAQQVQTIRCSIICFNTFPFPTQQWHLVPDSPCAQHVQSTRRMSLTPTRLSTKGFPFQLVTDVNMHVTDVKNLMLT